MSGSWGSVHVLFVFCSCSWGFSSVRVLFVFRLCSVLVLFWFCFVDIFKFLPRKKSSNELWIMLATQSIKARARQRGCMQACTIGLSINEDPKLEKGKEKKGSAA